MPYVSDFTALTTGNSRWNIADRLGTPTVVTYTFLDQGELPSTAEHAPLVFVEVSDPADASIQLLANRSSDPSAVSWAYFPDTTIRNGEAYLNSVYATITFNPNRPRRWIGRWGTRCIR